MSLDDPKQQEDIEEIEISTENQEKIGKYVEAVALKLQRVDHERAQIVIGLAFDIAALPGIEKWKVARIIVREFRQHGVRLNKSYIYSVLKDHPEYKNKDQSDASRQTQKELNRDGLDRATMTYFSGKFGTYDINRVADYGKSALQRIVNRQYEEIISLQERIKELEQSKH
jgi:hypothetical protein